jgi:hypothetical protein
MRLPATVASVASATSVRMFALVPASSLSAAADRHGILEIISRAIPCDRVGYNEITPDGAFDITVPDLDRSLIPKFAALIYENPLLQRHAQTGDGRPYRISDLIDQPTFHGLALYREFYRHIGIEWRVAFTLPARAPLIIGIALTRTRADFTDREVQLLALARPHLMQGGRVEFVTDGGRRLFGDTVASRRGLPEAVRSWISHHRNPRAAAQPLLLHTAEGTLLVRLLPNKRTDRREALASWTPANHFLRSPRRFNDRSTRAPAADGWCQAAS